MVEPVGTCERAEHKPGSLRSGPHGRHLRYCVRMKLRSECRCPKLAKENFTTSRNCVKTCYLAIQKLGLKCVKIFQKMFVFQKFLLPLQPAN